MPKRKISFFLIFGAFESDANLLSDPFKTGEADYSPVFPLQPIISGASSGVSSPEPPSTYSMVPAIGTGMLSPDDLI